MVLRLCRIARRLGPSVCCLLVANALATVCWHRSLAIAAEQSPLPPPALQKVDFHREVLPILSRQCARCHTGGKHEGSLAFDSRAKLLAGGDSGPPVVVGHSEKSLLIELVSGRDPDRVMPAEGRRLTNDEIGILRAWIDEGLPWEEGLSLSAYPTARWEPRRVELPSPDTGQREDLSSNPIDRLLAPYFKHHEIVPAAPVSDRTYARRVFLDLVGLIPRPEDIRALEQDPRPDKRQALVRRLLSSRREYAVHWLTFWNDALRNDYRGVGYIDGGRKQITGWLYAALRDDEPYDQFVRELVAPGAASEGFVKGIVWRGVVNASQRPEMQAAQNVSQVFLGINLKCASCHDSFVSEWKLDDSYGLASVFSDKPLEVHRCDSPTGRFVEPRFLSAKLGTIDPKAPPEERRRQLARIITCRNDGRLARTIVNRLWARLMGRGLVEPVDAMDNPPWHADLVDFLATDLTDHGYDLKRTLELIATSQAYQMPSVGAPPATEKDYVFRGPLVKRLSAEEFQDAVSMITGIWQPPAPNVPMDAAYVDGNPHAVTPGPPAKNKSAPARKGAGNRKPAGHPAAQGKSVPAAGPAIAAKPAPRSTAQQHQAPHAGQSGSPDFSRVGVRAALTIADPLARALGRPGREQVVTSRDSAATTLEVLELTNGRTLDGLLSRGADRWLKKSAGSPEKLIKDLYLKTLGRQPTPKEIEVAQGLLGSPPTHDGIQDLLWTLLMLPEFQLIE